MRLRCILNPPPLLFEKIQQPIENRSVPETTLSKESKLKQIILRVYFLLVVAEGILTLRSILRIPREAESAFLFGLSEERLLLSGGVLVVTLAVAWLVSKSWLQQAWFRSFLDKLVTRLHNQKTRGSIILLSIMGIISGSNFILLIPEISEPVTLAYYVRLQPIVLWVAILCGQTLVALPLLHYGFDLKPLKPKHRLVYAIALIFGLFLIIWAWLGRTGYGLISIDVGVGWYRLGTPILETQVFLAWGITMGLLFLWTWTAENPNTLRWSQFIQKDIAVGILLWVAAFTLWMSIPLEANWFASPPRPPNSEFYPNSDASVYDITAQNVLIGEGFKTRGSPFTLRPMYGLFLAVLHTLGGLSYAPIIWMQVAVLALIPIFIYGLTKLIHNRVSGTLAATLLILREGNAIALGSSISEAHAKLLMPFLPTTFGVLLTILVIVAWLQNPPKRQTLTLVSGGVIGIFMLIRPEFGVLLPIIGLAALLQLMHRPGDWFKGMALITIGLVLMLSPWIWRNYQITGTIFIDSPQYRIDLFARRYREDPIGFVIPTPAPKPTEAAGAIDVPIPTPNIIPQPGETTEEYTARMAEDVIEYVQENPEKITNFVLNHFFNSVIQTVLYLPSTYQITNSAIEYLGYHSPDQFWQECCSVKDYPSRLPFWRQWDGHLPRQSIVPITLTLFTIATGISMAWKQQRFCGLIPLLAAVGYYLINAFARNSGGRYIIPLDWVGIFYFSIGLIQLTIWGTSYFREFPLPIGNAGDDQTGIERGNLPLWHIPNLGIAAGIFILGCALPIVERVIPSRYTDIALETRLSALLQADHSILMEEEIGLLENFIANNGSALLGRALYPRYNRAYEMGSVWDISQPRPYKRIDFYLSSPHGTGVVLPFQKKPNTFPHAADVIVFGCPHYRNLDALAIVLFSAEGVPEEILFRSPMPEQLTCPFSPPK